jgi:hypothetical protein
MGYFKEAKKARGNKPKPTAKRCFIWCSRCHVNPRPPAEKPSNFDKSVFDRWCDHCLITSPLIERSRKCSRGELKKLLQRKQEERDKLAEERAEILKLKLERAEQAKANGKANPVQPKKRKKGAIEELFTLSFDEDFLLDYLNNEAEATGEKLETSYDRMRRLTARISDPTIYHNANDLVKDN